MATFGSSAESFFDAGYVKYKEGEKTTSNMERKKAFNEALSLYLHQVSAQPSGYLLYNIGNCYFQLQEYGLARLYYERAKTELPRFRQIPTNIHTTIVKAGIELQVSEKSHFWKTFFLVSYFSYFEKELIFLAACLFAFAFASLYLWLEISAFRHLRNISLAIGVLVGCVLLYCTYLTPLEAIVLQPVSLSQGPGSRYAAVMENPLLPAEKVQVIEIIENGSWLFVETGGKEKGYISGINARVI